MIDIALQSVRYDISPWSRDHINPLTAGVAYIRVFIFY